MMIGVVEDKEVCFFNILNASTHRGYSLESFASIYDHLNDWVQDAILYVTVILWHHDLYSNKCLNNSCGGFQDFSVNFKKCIAFLKASNIIGGPWSDVSQTKIEILPLPLYTLQEKRFLII